MSPEPRELSSWKEIAAYLGVSTRAAQMWEKERGLPIRRLPGLNRVLAYTSELDQWKDKFVAPAPATDLRPGGEEQPVLHLARLPGLRATAPAIAIAALAFGILAFLFLKPKAPVPFALNPDRLGFTVTDHSGKVLWRKVFPQGIRDHEDGRYWGVIADVDGDGNPEVLFAPQPNGGSPREVPLICYQADGTELWSFHPSEAEGAQALDHPAEFWAHLIVMLPASAAPARIAVGSHHRTFSPYQVAFLSASGKPLRVFWHAGHFQAAALRDINGDGNPELLMGGINNSRQMAELIALDPAAARGAAPEADGRFARIPVAHGIARVFFPPTPLNKLVDYYNMVNRIAPSGQGIDVHVAESLNAHLPQAIIVHHLNPDLTPAGTVMSDRFAFMSTQHRAKMEAPPPTQVSWE